MTPKTRATKLAKIYRLAGYDTARPIPFDSAVRSGRVEPGTYAFAVQDSRGYPQWQFRFVGVVVIHPGDTVTFEGDGAMELEAVVESFR